MTIAQSATQHLAGFGLRLKAFREAKGWTQMDVAESTGLKVTAVSHFECGQRLPNATNLYKLCSALNCPPGYLLGLEQKCT